MPKVKAKPNGKENKEAPRVSMKEKITQMLELPKDVVLNLPKLTMIGNANLIVENYKGIIEYENNRIRINTGAGAIKITGERLLIKEITSEDIIVEGEINSLEFYK